MEMTPSELRGNIEGNVRTTLGTCGVVAKDVTHVTGVLGGEGGAEKVLDELMAATW